MNFFGPCHFIHSYETGFYKTTILKVHPPICRFTSTTPGQFLPSIMVMWLFQMGYFNGLFSGGGIRTHYLLVVFESSTLTTISRLLALNWTCLFFKQFSKYLFEHLVSLNILFGKFQTKNAYLFRPCLWFIVTASFQKCMHKVLKFFFWNNVIFR